MKTIIIATDYSRPAAAALDYAAQLASHTRAKLVLYHAFHLAVPSSTPPATLTDVDELIAISRNRLENMAAEIGQRYQITTDSLLTTLTFMDGLQKTVKKHEAALVVMGIKSHSLGRRYFGSSTTAAIGEAQFSVLVVPEEAAFRPVNNILFACDYNSIAHDNKLQLLSEVARTFGATVQVLHVATGHRQLSMAETADALKIPAMEAILQDIPHSYHFMQGGELVESLTEGIKKHKADLLVMVPHTPSIWDKLLNKSKTREMALETSVPLLVLPNIKIPAKGKVSKEPATPAAG